MDFDYRDDFEFFLQNLDHVLDRDQQSSLHSLDRHPKWKEEVDRLYPKDFFVEEYALCRLFEHYVFSESVQILLMMNLLLLVKENERLDDDERSDVMAMVVVVVAAEMVEIDYSSHIVRVYNTIHHLFDVILILLVKEVVNIQDDDDELSPNPKVMDN
jgi:hypothetical protein